MPESAQMKRGLQQVSADMLQQVTRFCEWMAAQAEL
jgi:hypothetical protein